MKKSFTLIELLVAVSIFVTVVVISLATVVNLTRNRTSTESLTNVQLSGNLAMEMMVTAVSNSSPVGSSPAFYFADYLGNELSGGGPSLRVNKESSGYLRIFKLQQRDGDSVRDLDPPLIDGGSTCPSGKTCVLGMLDRVGETEPTRRALTGPDVSVTGISFSGSKGSSTQKGYATIEITLQSTWAQANNQPLTLHTTIISQL